jgi:16S rRNA processing protein RimM
MGHKCNFVTANFTEKLIFAKQLPANEMEEYFKIGKFVAGFGVKGELILQHALGKKTALKGLQAVFIEENKDSFLPYFIETVTIRTEQENLVKIEDIDTPEQAKKLVRREVWLKEADFKKFSRTTAPVSLLGFMLYDGAAPVGEIIEVMEMPHQLLCKVMYQNVEALIPLHEASLKKIDRRNKKVVVELPDGLLDIYT